MRSLEQLLDLRRSREHVEVQGLEWVAPHRGWLHAGAHRVEVRAEPDGGLFFSMAIARGSVRDRLEQSHQLPGNLRFAHSGERACLLADAAADPGTLQRAVAEIRVGLAEALGAGHQRAADGAADVAADDTPVEAGRVEAALEALGWDDDAVVRLQSGWELRLRAEGGVCAVRMTLDGSSVRLDRTVMSARPVGQAGVVVAEQALRFNHQLKWARLAARGDQLLVESRVHGDLLSAASIGRAVRAVTAAVRHSADTLQLLATDDVTSQWYAELLVPRTEPAPETPDGVRGARRGRPPRAQQIAKENQAR